MRARARGKKRETFVVARAAAAAACDLDRVRRSVARMCLSIALV